MSNISPFMQAFEKLPETLPIFPLTNAVVLPGGQLPLNIFEGRYLNMIQDVMKSHRLIGMIQPRDETNNPKLYEIGCAARVTQYEEMVDGRLEITLTGLCRFEITEELVTTRGYRLVIPNWSKFEIDCEAQGEPDNATHLSFINTLRNHFSEAEMQVDWEVMEKLDTEDLFHTFFFFLRLSNTDKQMLIEMDTLEQRIIAIVAILGSNNQDYETQH